MTDFKKLSQSRLRKMTRAGQQVLECYRLLGKTDANIVGEVLKGHGEFFEWDHYPPGDVFDHETNAQYYYHAHPPEGRAEKFGAEHGHFHTFLRPKGMPKNIKPAKVADYEKPKEDNDELTHFIGISMSPAGFPIRLFTTNRWVTGEVWYKASSVISMIDRFLIDQAYPSLVPNIWVSAMVQLFRPDIEEMLHERDQAVRDWEKKYPGKNVYEDRDLELTSIRNIAVDKQIKQVKRALKAA